MKKTLILVILFVFTIGTFGLAIAGDKKFKIQELLKPEKIGHDEFKYFKLGDKIKKNKFKQYEIGDRVVCFHQRKIGNAIVEKDFLNYQFNKKNGKFLTSNVRWRKSLPEQLPVDLLTAQEIADSDVVEGEILFSELYFIAPDSDVFPLDSTLENPCWIIRSIIENGDHVISIIDAVTGEFIGNGVTPPTINNRYKGFSMTGPIKCNPGNYRAWTNWYNNADYWFQNAWADGVSSLAIDIQWPIETDIQYRIQNWWRKVDLFYEIAHGGSSSFLNECVNYTTASDIQTWMASRQPMKFAFIASCDGMCSTGSGSFSDAFRKGSYSETATVGYCGMSTSPCSSCWTVSLSWQDELFQKMWSGPHKIKNAFDLANAAFPQCIGCMRFAGDPKHFLSHCPDTNDCM